MISQVMAYCKNHFDRSQEVKPFEIVADGIVGIFSEKYITGQYVWIYNSFINDGVYKILTATSDKLTLDATLQAENTGETIYVYGLAVPTDFLSIVDDITSWVSKNSGKAGIASESIDSYSVSFGTGTDGNTSNTWQSAFSGQLSLYKQVYETPTSNYGDSKRW